MRFWIRRRSSGSVTSLQSSDFCLDDFLEVEELEPPPWCRDEREDDIFFDLAVCSVSVSEPDSTTDLEDLASRFFVPDAVPLPLSLLFCEEDEDFRL